MLWSSKQAPTKTETAESKVDMRKVSTRKKTKSVDTELSDLADDARALLVATADVAGHQVTRARNRLNAALERGMSNGEDLIDASMDMAGNGAQELRDRITDALESGKEMYDDVHDDVVKRAKAADHTVRNNPYRVMGITLGIGALIGYLGSLRHHRNGS